MGQIPERERFPVKGEAGLEDGYVECLPIVRDNRSEIPLAEEGAHLLDHPPLFGHLPEEKLEDAEPVLMVEAEAYEEGDRSGSSGQARSLEIDENGR